MENVLINKWPRINQLTILLGSVLLAACAQIKLPFYPVSFTLHTFAVFVLGLTLSPVQAFSAVCYYLIGKTLFTNPLWMIGPAAGYYVAFPFAAYFTAKMKRSPFLAILCAQSLIFMLGYLWLIPLLGVKTAFTKGILLFIPSDLLKILAAVCITTKWRKHEHD